MFKHIVKTSNALPTTRIISRTFSDRAAVRHPDGRIYVRPGKQNPLVFDDTKPIEDQQDQVRKRVLELNQDAQRKVVGDPLVVQARINSSVERLSRIFNDDVRPFLDSTTRSSPIYKDVPIDKRTPRVLLPADTHTSFAATPGVLHAYRMHHVRMLLAKKKNRREILKHKLDTHVPRKLDATMEPIEGMDNAAIQEFVTYFSEMARIHAGPRVAPPVLDAVKRIIPLIVKTETKTVVTVRKRRK